MGRTPYERGYVAKVHPELRHSTRAKRLAVSLLDRGMEMRREGLV